MNKELTDVQIEFLEAQEPEIKLPTFDGSWRKQGDPRETSISAELTMWSLWMCESQQTVENS